MTQSNKLDQAPTVVEVRDPKFDERLDLEFAYTSYEGSCKDLFNHAYRCRRPVGHKDDEQARPVGHEDDHAAGFGAERIVWRSTESDAA